MRYLLFGDESTLPRMRRILSDADLLIVRAVNRPQSEILSQFSHIVHPTCLSDDYRNFCRIVKEFEPDAFICFSYSMIIGENLLSIPRLGAINIHGGLLPQYRGANVLNWAIIEGATQTGVTAHYMTSGIDEGDIIFREEVPITQECTAKILKENLDEIGFRMVHNINEMLHSKMPLPRLPQDNSLAKYYRRRCPEDGLIDWNQSEADIHNLIRALVKPWPGAFYYNQDNVKIIIDHYLTIEEISKLKKEING